MSLACAGVPIGHWREWPIRISLGSECHAKAYRAVLSSFAPLAEEAAKAGVFSITLFFPICNGVTESNLANNKVKELNIDWKGEPLRAYANHVMRGLRRLQNYWVFGNRLPDFTQMVGGSKCAALVWDKLDTPRHMNAFLLDLFSRLGVQESLVGGSDCCDAERALEAALRAVPCNYSNVEPHIRNHAPTTATKDL